VTYRVEVGPAARRQLYALPEAVAAAVLNFLEGPLAENPRRVGKALTGSLEGLSGARRGAYRILYRIDDDRTLVTVIKIAHRKDVYRP